MKALIERLREGVADTGHLIKSAANVNATMDEAAAALEQQVKLCEELSAVIEQMRDAHLFFIGWAERNAMWNKCDSSYYLAKKALALQPHASLVAKIKADAVREAAHEAWMSANSDCEDRVKAAVMAYADRIEREGK